MRSKYLNRFISVLMSVSVIASFTAGTLTTSAAVLEDGYEDKIGSYQSLGILEDQYDLIEPANNRFPIISPNRKYDTSSPKFFIGTYKEVEEYFKEQGMTDGLPIVPPTKIKAEKFLGYSSYNYDEVVATINGKDIKAYQVAANAIMAGCSAEHMPVCIAFAEALSDSKYLESLKSGKLTPMMYVNGPMAHQIGIDSAQGMTTEETNFAIGRYMELALINLAGIKRTNAFGNIQPLVFSENDEACLNIGWKPHHVEKGYKLNDNVITATSFSMWGNNVTPATDLPDEIMKVLAWDITEKNLCALGSASIEDNANTHRLIFITESVASALSKKYKSKSSLESALVENARRPLWMRAYAYYYANIGGTLSKSFDDVYSELKETPSEDAKSTVSPAWMNGITYSNIDTVATMVKGNTDIIITGDSSRNKTQVMPGGISTTKEIKLSDNWDKLVTSMNYNPIESFYLTEQNNIITPPTEIPNVLTTGTYRILDPSTGAKYLTRKGNLYYNSENKTLYYYASNASKSSSIVLDDNKYNSFIDYLTNLGSNSSFTINNGKFTDITIRFSSIAKKLCNNTIALTKESFNGINLSLHANNTSKDPVAGGIAQDGATVELSSSVTSYNVNLNGDIIMGDTTNENFVTLNGTTVIVDPSVQAGATAIIGSANENGTFRTMTFVNGGDGTYTITYNTANTLSITDSTIDLKSSFNNNESTDTFMKTNNSDIVSLTKELTAGQYTFKLYNRGIDKSYGTTNTSINDSANRVILVDAGEPCVLNVTGGTYEFKYEISTNRLSIYSIHNNGSITDSEEQQEEQQEEKSENSTRSIDPSLTQATSGKSGLCKIDAILSVNKKYVYTGKKIRPNSIKVKSGAKVLTRGKDYATSYKNNKQIGIAKITVTGKGNYIGTLTKTFKIIPKSTKLKKLSVKNSNLTVKWDKLTKQVTGYEIQCATNKAFSKNCKSVAVNKNSATSTVIKRLKSNNKYFVRIRTFKLVENTKYYSKWSAVKTVKIR